MVVGKYSFAYLGSGVKNQYWYFSIKIWTLPIKSSCPWFPLLPPSPPNLVRFPDSSLHLPLCASREESTKSFAEAQNTLPCQGFN